MEERPAVKERVETKRVEEAKDPVGRYTRVGLWALPVFALLLGVGTSTHQPPPQTQLADWSRYVTTDIFLIKHLVASIGGAVFGVLGIVAMGIAFVRLGSIRLGLWGLVTGVAANVLLSSIFGVAAYTQPAIGRFFLAGHHDLAQSLYYDAAQGTPMVLMALTGLLLLLSSLVIFGVATTRRPELPPLAGIGLAISVVLFALIGFALDNWVQTVASLLMLASSTWIVIALSRVDRRISDATI